MFRPPFASLCSVRNSLPLPLLDHSLVYPSFLNLFFVSFIHRFVEIMAPVFSRDAWRCVWYMIQVCSEFCYFSFLTSKSLNCTIFLVTVCIFLPSFAYCRMTWYMVGVSTWPSKGVLRSVMQYPLKNSRSILDSLPLL